MRAPPANRVFISYRRDDAAGYAGRLETALEQRLGHGSAFRDVQDIVPGEDFARLIGERVAGAAAVVVLIGPRWAGSDAAGRRRIDDEGDFVRLEVQAALASGARVVPVLLPGAAMPTDAELPPALKPLAGRHALAMSETHWDADVARLVDSLGLARQRRAWPWALGGAAVAAAAVGAACWWAPWSATGPADAGDRLLGRWQAEVRYDWGDRHTERLEFTRHAGEITGTADYLGYPRPVEQLSFDGANLRFVTRSTESMGSEERQKTHAYSAELRGQPPHEVLAFRLQTTGGFGSHRPVSFEARRVAPAGPASTPATR
jgi:hypothetical protein